MSENEAKVIKNPIGWVEVPVFDLDRAQKFYETFFGFKMDRQPPRNGYEMSWFPANMAKYGTSGMLISGPSYVPSEKGAILYYNSPEKSLKAGVERAKSQKIEVLVPETPIGAAAEHGYFAILKDSEGNSFAIHSMEA